MVDYRCDEYNYWYTIWEKTRDGIKGQEAVKAKQEKYLPRLGGQTDASYNAYLNRAQYVNFSARTMTASLGQLFRKTPQIDGVDEMFIDNFDLSGSTFYQASREIAYEVLSINKVGLLVDYSDQFKRPYCTVFQAESIINYRTEIIDGAEKLTLVMLEGKINEVDPKDKYKTEKVTIWRELYLEDNVYKSRLHKKNDENKIIVVEGSEITPVINNKVFTFIPFFFITSEGIENKTSKSAMMDFVNINIGHYCNSADFESMVHWAGAKTVITKGWGKDPFPLGAAAEVGETGDAYYLESSSDSCIKDAMQKKEEQMAALGSQIISGKGRYVASAETSRIGEAGEHATLADIANSLSYTMSTIMSLVMNWHTGKAVDVTIEYNTDFEAAEIPQGKLTELMSAVQSGYMSMETFFYNMRNYEMYPTSWTYDEETAAIKTSMVKQVTQRQTEIDNNVADKMTPIERTDDAGTVSK